PCEKDRSTPPRSQARTCKGWWRPFSFTLPPSVTVLLITKLYARQGDQWQKRWTDFLRRSKEAAMTPEVEKKRRSIFEAHIRDTHKEDIAVDGEKLFTPSRTGYDWH